MGLCARPDWPKSHHVLSEYKPEKNCFLPHYLYIIKQMKNPNCRWHCHSKPYILDHKQFHVAKNPKCFVPYLSELDATSFLG